MTMHDVTMLGWLVILVGALSACLGLYLQVVNTSEVPIRYSLGFYLFGTGFALSHSSQYFASDGPALLTVQIAGVFIVATALTVAAWDLQRVYSVCGPVKSIRRIAAGTVNKEEEEEERIILNA